MNTGTRDKGEQPLVAVLDAWGLENHDLVEASSTQLTHKQVQRARRGRMLTLSMMQKVTRDLNAAIAARLTKPERQEFADYRHRDLFNYAKGHDAGFEDPNGALVEAVKKRTGESEARS